MKNEGDFNNQASLFNEKLANQRVKTYTADCGNYAGQVNGPGVIMERHKDYDANLNC